MACVGGLVLHSEEGHWKDIGMMTERISRRPGVGWGTGPTASSEQLLGVGKQGGGLPVAS